MSRIARRVGAAVAILAFVAQTTTAQAVEADKTGGPSSTQRFEREPTPAELARQQITVQRLQAAVQQQTQEAAHARVALDATSRLAGQALEASATAVRNLQVSQQVELQRQAQLEQARQAVETQRAELGRWAREAYQGGTNLTADPTMTVLLSAQAGQDLSTNVTVLRWLGDEHGRNLAAVQATQVQADRATDTAAAATSKAADAAVTATNARRQAEAALALQQKLVGDADAALSDGQQGLTQAQQHQQDLRAAAEQATANRVMGQVGNCAGGDDIGQYANGQIPLDALCPLQANPQQRLRADAAYAFDRLTFAYTQKFGRAPCITDSYRSYAAQVDVFARKPGLAAVPGTSNHGWGTALDLCGGIESFTSIQHTWMLQNAPLFGWFHPSWAEPTGSKPEPWHWEYSAS